MHNHTTTQYADDVHGLDAGACGNFEPVADNEERCRNGGHPRGLHC